jgi:MFS family permease
MAMNRSSEGLLQTFFGTKATVAILAVSALLSFGIASTVGIVPEILSDRYARLHHAYDGPSCSDWEDDVMPAPCIHGADDAQAASAIGTLVLNTFTLFCNPVVGSLSDVHGRRMPIVFGMFLSTLSPLVLVLMQIIPALQPGWYYLASSSVGIVNYMSIMFAAISDVVPEELRAPSFAIMLAGWYSGFALAPSFPLLMTHFQVSILSLVLAVSAFLLSFLFFPETLPESVASRRTMDTEETPTSEEDSNFSGVIVDFITKPFQKATILNRSATLRMLTVGSFFSSMVFSTDSNLVLFYVESHLNVRDKDISRMFFVMGCLGIVMQGFLLQPFIKCLGEKGLLVASFLSGTLHNFLYGVARDKRGIFVALCLSQFTKLNFPILSSIASKGASESEQGQVQGSLFSINALAAGAGPMLMQFIYDKTKDTIGPGTMFVFASFLYFLGTIAISFMPLDNESDSNESESASAISGLEEPLISPETPSCAEEISIQPQSSDD